MLVLMHNAGIMYMYIQCVHCTCTYRITKVTLIALCVAMMMKAQIFKNATDNSQHPACVCTI